MQITETKFTAGPWRVAGETVPECWIVENDEGDFIAQTKDAAGFVSLDGVTNAALIAAAPDLYESAVDLIYILSDFEGDYGDPEFIHALDLLAVETRAALAKARGEQV